MKRMLVALAVLGMAGCFMQPVSTPTQAFEMDDGGIKDAWGRAQSWVALNSKLKIQTATDYLIETYGPQASEGNINIFAYQIVRTPLGGSRSKITVTCVPANPYEHDAAQRTADQLARYIQTGQ